MLSSRRTKHNAAIASSDDCDATTVIGPIVWKYPEEESHFDQEIEQELGGDKLKHLSNGQVRIVFCVLLLCLTTYLLAPIARALATDPKSARRIAPSCPHAGPHVGQHLAPTEG